MCLILKHAGLAQYGMSHLAKGMVVPVIGSLVVAFSLLCMAKEFTCLRCVQPPLHGEGIHVPPCLSMLGLL